MIENTIEQSFNEVYDIINHMNPNLYNKIPKSFIDMLEQKRDRNYKVSIDYSIDINKQKLLHKTRVILSLIYRDYLCGPEQREKLRLEDKMELEKYRQEIEEKYDLNNIFKNRNVEDIKNNTTTETQIVVREEKWYNKFFKFIIRIFKKK